jgi:hypothetical protein
MYTEVMNAGGTTRTITFCMEPPGLPSVQEPSFRAGCEMPVSVDAGVSMTMTGVYASQGCSRANVAGGCQMTSGGMLLTVWYYADALITTDAVKQQCAPQGGTFVTP